MPNFKCNFKLVNAKKYLELEYVSLQDTLTLLFVFRRSGGVLNIGSTPAAKIQAAKGLLYSCRL